MKSIGDAFFKSRWLIAIKIFVIIFICYIFIPFFIPGLKLSLGVGRELYAGFLWAYLIMSITIFAPLNVFGFIIHGETPLNAFGFTIASFLLVTVIFFIVRFIVYKKEILNKRKLNIVVLIVDYLFIFAFIFIIVFPYFRTLDYF